MLSWVLPFYERGRAAYSRLVDIYEEPIEVQDNPSSTLQTQPNADITFKDLTFTYPLASRPSLQNLNLHINGGSFVGITGPVGAGKSTIFKILNRAYEIPPNHLYINGHEIHEYSLNALRADMVTVEQAAFLFSRSLGDNVRFGRAEASHEELELVAQYADLHETVMSFPEKYDTLVGERGVTLSGGQKQRIAMARAFLVDRSILLLDDIFSAVDSKTEKHIFESIKKHFTGKTVLIITHRVSVLEQMDRIVYMIDGKVEEDGTPAELIEKKGHFAALAELRNAGSAE
jgi:ATP-binding cassette subfamily B protein